jgi:predicted ribosomally synthesized peptide with nif11-like leader
MGKEAAARFIALLAEDPDLRKQVAGSQLGALVRFAAERGFDFTADELEAMADGLVKLHAGELTDTELEGVAGGVLNATSLQVGGSAELIRVAAGIKGMGAPNVAVVVYGADTAGPLSRE